MSAEKVFDGGLFGGREDCVLGIDPSLTGFAVTALSVTSPSYTTWVYRSEYRGVERLADISNWLEQRIWHVLRSRRIADVAIEGGVVHSHSSFILGELHGAVKLVLLQAPIGAGRYPLQVPPMSLKKFVTGRGNGVKKNEMLLHTFKKWDVEFNDDNAADSFGLAYIARCTPTTKYEEEVLSKLSGPKFRDTGRDAVS